MMRHSVWFVILWVLGFSSMALCQNVVFGARLLQAGRTISTTLEETGSTENEVKLSGNLLDTIHEEWKNTRRKIETILEVNGEIVRSVKVVYEVAEGRSTTVDNGVKDDLIAEREAIAGHSYIVKTSSDGSISVTNPEGKLVTRDETELVKEDYEGLGKMASLTQFFRNKTISVGQELHVPPEVAEEILHEKSLRVEYFSMSLKGTRMEGATNAAVFDTMVKLAGLFQKKATVKASITMKGETLIAIEGAWPIACSLTGPMKVTGVDQVADRVVMVTGTGQMTVVEKRTYGK